VTLKVFKPVELYSKRADTKIEKLNFLTAIMNYARRIVVAVDNISAATNTLYTVPAGKIFYLNAAGVFLIVTGGAGSSNAYLYARGITDSILQLQGTLSNSSLSNAITFTIPLRFTAGEKITLEQLNGTATAGGNISGYEIDASLVPTFL